MFAVEYITLNRVESTPLTVRSLHLPTTKVDDDTTTVSCINLVPIVDTGRIQLLVPSLGGSGTPGPSP
jgi:hypothetical protein